MSGKPREVERICRTHGRTVFVLENRGAYRCRECRKMHVAEWRRRAKLRLIEEAGGCCVLCGYHRCVRALHFHHLDPATKEFGIARQGVARSKDRLREEVSKCVLLCSNCHAEVEAGSTQLEEASPR